MIEQCSILDEYKEIIRMNKISTEKEVNIPNGKEIKLENMFDINISFGQVNTFKVEEKEISFEFIGFVTEELKKDTNISMIVDLIINDKLIEEEAICTALEDILPKDGIQLPAEFKCKVEDVKNANECTGLEIVESDEISGIPTEPDLLNPAIVDELIEVGEIINYTSEEFKNTEIPVFNATSINTTESRKKGIFTIIGELLSEFELEEKFEFEITLMTGEKSLCTLPKISGKGEVEIECELQESIKDGKLMIEQFSVFDGYNELIRINKFSTEEKITISNGKEIKLENKFNNFLSFRQTNTFEFDSVQNSATFTINAFTTKHLEKGDEISIDVNILLIDDSKKDEAKCQVEKDITLPKSVLKLPVDFKCEIKNIELNIGSDCLGVEIEDSEDIINIPKNKKLCNPDKVDKLIEEGLIEKATEKLDDPLPEFNATSIDTSESISNGIFTIEGKPLEDIKKEFKFNLTLVTEQIAICTLPKSPKGINAKIACVLDGIIEKSKISIPQTTIFEGYKEMFTLNKIQTERKVSCSNGKLKQMNKKLENKISFRQMSHFIPSEKECSFTFSSFVQENMKKRKRNRYEY